MTLQWAPVNPKERKAHFDTFSLNREPDKTIRIIAGVLDDCPNVFFWLCAAHEPSPAVYVGIACSSAKARQPYRRARKYQLLRVNTRVYADEAFAARIPLITDASRKSHPLDPLAAFEEASTSCAVDEELLRSTEVFAGAPTSLAFATPTAEGLSDDVRKRLKKSGQSSISGEPVHPGLQPNRYWERFGQMSEQVAL
ncbi:BQ5605_C003g01906 [Microbotryum silenes-dioicae]|uniref:BQ5605_C003g01906 protein n=1 Tax=Microbotryum silenes-dioicae TaxID=796604 RepID=A0A2X0NXH7_9BASI|nr:BQ5605_C003g01906 [Microbotryum silenes-dioicae]